MSERLLDALRVCLDLEEGQAEVESALAEASPSERELFFDRLLFEALLRDTLRKAPSSTVAKAGPSPASAQPRRNLVLTFRFMAAAAVFMIVIGGAWFWYAKIRYAQPELSNLSPAGETVATKPLWRGEPVTVGAGGARLDLGGYCRLAFDPKSEFVLRGERRNEAVELVKGRAVCKVTPERGQFSVQTPLGRVRVVGTEFSAAVQYPEPKGTEKPPAVVTVAVISGTVEYEFGVRKGTLKAGETRLFEAETRGAQAPAAPGDKAERMRTAMRRLQSGFDLRDQRKYDEAIGVLQSALREFPDATYPDGRLVVPGAAYCIGFCYYRKKDMAKAEEAFEEALEKYPRERTGYGELFCENYLPIILFVDDACTKAGRGTSRTIEKLKSTFPERVLLEARAKAFTPDEQTLSEDIARKYPQFVTTDKTPNAGGLLRVGFGLKDKGRYDEAIEVFEGIVRVCTEPRWSSTEAWAAYAIGESYWLKKDMIKAQKAFDAALEKYPKERAASGRLYAEMFLPTILKVDAACAKPGEGPSRMMQRLGTILPEEVLEKARAKVPGQ